jgi:hypothetical protein
MPRARRFSGTSASTLEPNQEGESGWRRAQSTDQNSGLTGVGGIR